MKCDALRKRNSTSLICPGWCCVHTHPTTSKHCGKAVICTCMWVIYSISLQRVNIEAIIGALVLDPSCFCFVFFRSGQLAKGGFRALEGVGRWLWWRHVQVWQVFRGEIGGPVNCVDVCSVSAHVDFIFLSLSSDDEHHGRRRSTRVRWYCWWGMFYCTPFIAAKKLLWWITRMMLRKVACKKKWVFKIFHSIHRNRAKDFETTC